MTGSTKLVIGASGLLGFHITRPLVENGERVRVMLRSTSSTEAIDDLDVQRSFGRISDDHGMRPDRPTIRLAAPTRSTDLMAGSNGRLTTAFVGSGEEELQ